ncbi:MAG TPA: methyltransferase domain-containing protein, partial [Planctomycetota bacterium]|nr:methyltransferase domain-containing protein [Planctomycetota bacterium]
YLQADLHPAVQVIESAIDDAKTLGEARLRGRFDLVVAFGSFPWLPAEPTFLAAVLRSLRPGGRFVFDVPALGYCDALEACEGRHFHWPLVSEQDFQAALEDSGFRACSVETIDSTRNFATLAELVDERSKPFPLDFENTLGVERQEALRNDLAAWFDRDHDLLLVLRHIAGQAMR